MEEQQLRFDQKDEKLNQNQKEKENSIKVKLYAQYPQIQGLFYISDVITKQQQQKLIKNIYNANQSWNTTLKRRTQHYGYQYSYLLKNTVKQAQPIPQWIIPIKEKIQKIINQINTQRSIVKEQKIMFDQVIVNQYQPGQGISPHIDNTDLFGQIVVSLSLASPAIMFFQNQYKTTSNQNINKSQEGKPIKKVKKQQFNPEEISLKRRSLVVLSGPARYQWKHSIPARKKDDGVARSTRVSLTFRIMKKINLQDKIKNN